MVIECPSATIYIQVKSRQPHLGYFRKSEVARNLVEGWGRQANRLADPASEFILVLEQPFEGAEPGEHVLATTPVGHELSPLIAQSVGSDETAEILRRSQVWIWPNPERRSVDQLAAHLNLPEMACLTHIHALRRAVGEAANCNASARESDQHGLSVTDVTATMDRIANVLDAEGLLEAVKSGVCEPVDLLSPKQDDHFYKGVDVVPGHIAAGLTHPRPSVLAEVVDALEGRQVVLVAGPSGAGKSAILWMTAYENRHVRWYRVRRLQSHDDVIALVRLAHAHLPTEQAPVAFVVDNVGQPGTEAWDELAQELAGVPGAYLLGAVREEDLFLVRTLPLAKVVRLRLDEELAASIYAELHSRGLTVWPHWREPYEGCKGLLLEYLHLLSEGTRLDEVVSAQVRARYREERAVELRILSVAGTATAWGAEIPLAEIVKTVQVSEAAVSTALHRLVGEHLLQQRADGSIAGLHKLRSRAIFAAVHERPPPTPAESISSAIAAIPPDQLHTFLVGVLVDEPELLDDVVTAATARLEDRLDAELATAVLQAFRVVEFRDLATQWLEVLEAEGVPRAMRPLVVTLVIAGSDLTALSSFLDPRVLAATERLRQIGGQDGRIRKRLIAALPEGWPVRCLSAQDDCGVAARLLATLDGLGEDEPSLRSLPGLEGTPLANALVDASLADVAEVIGSARSVSIETARRLAALTGGPEALASLIERGTPWCRGLRVGKKADGLLDGRDVDLDPEALVARVEYRYVSDLVQDDVHDATVELARRASLCLPDVRLVRALAVDARDHPHGFGGLEMANKWLAREVLNSKDVMAWNRTRIRTIESMLAAASQTDRIAAEVELIGRSARLVRDVATMWLTGRGGSKGKLAQLEADRMRILEEADDLPPLPTNALDQSDPLELGMVGLRDSVHTLLRNLLVQVVPGVFSVDRDGARIASVLERVISSVEDLKTCDRWRYLGLEGVPSDIGELSDALGDLAAVVSEVAFGDAPIARFQTVGRAAPHRTLALGAAARDARQRAKDRHEAASQRIRQSIKSLALDAEILDRPSKQAIPPWPPIDLLILAHLERLDQWPTIVEALPSARGELTAAHRVWAVPVREGVAVPPLGAAVLSDKVLPDLDVWNDWKVEGREALGDGACQAFRGIVEKAVGLSSMAALPGGVKSGHEEQSAERLAQELGESLHALLQLLESHPDDPVISEASQVAQALVERVGEEFQSHDVAGQLAVAFLDSLDGAQSDVTNTVAGATCLLAEWDIAPDVARSWYLELVS